MRLQNLEYLFFLIPVFLLVLVLLIHSEWNKNAKFKTHFGLHTFRKLYNPSVRKNILIRHILFLSAILFVGFSVLRPQWGYTWEKVSRKGIDIFIAVDVSLSMLAKDISPNRLERSKREIKDLVKKLTGDRIGLISFAGASFLQCPLTSDYSSFEIFLEELEAGMIPYSGTSIENAISTARTSFKENSKNSKAIILITDGEDHSKNAQNVIKETLDSNISLYTVIVGTKDGAPIPDPENGGYIKNQSGNLVISKPEYGKLEQILNTKGGKIFKSNQNEYGLTKVYQELKGTLKDSSFSEGTQKKHSERFQWFLFIAFMFVAIEYYNSEKKGGGFK